MNNQQPASILVVEDDPDLQFIAVQILTMQGYQVIGVNDGIKAIQAIKQRAPDLVLLDVLMPRMDGRDFLRNLDTSAHPGMRIVVTSNLSDAEMATEMLQLGADEIVLKSDLNPNRLIDMVERQLSL